MGAQKISEPARNQKKKPRGHEITGEAEKNLFCANCILFCIFFCCVPCYASPWNCFFSLPVISDCCLPACSLTRLLAWLPLLAPHPMIASIVFCIIFCNCMLCLSTFVNIFSCCAHPRAKFSFPVILKQSRKNFSFPCNHHQCVIWAMVQWRAAQTS